MATTAAAGFAVEMLVMLGAPFALAIWAHRRHRTPWRVFLIAAGFFLANLAVNVPLTAGLWPALFGNDTWTTLAFVTLTYGVCEETARYLSFRAGRTMRANRTPDGALAAGLGHGGTESLVFGLQYGYGMLVVLLLPSALPPGTAERTLATGGLVFALTGTERLIAMACHIGFATLTVLAYRRSATFLPVAVVAHAVVDFTVFGLQKAAPGLWYQLLFLGFAVLALTLHLVVRRRRTLVPEVPTPAPVAAPVQAATATVPRIGTKAE